MDNASAAVDAELRARVVTSINMLLPKVLKRDVPPQPEDVGLFDALGLTSLNTLALIVHLEEALDIAIDVEEIGPSDLRSLGALADFVAAHTITED